MKKNIQIWQDSNSRGETKATSAEQRSNYVDCACRIVELIGLVASNEHVSHKVSIPGNAALP